MSNLPDRPDECEQCGQSEPLEWYDNGSVEGWYCVDCIQTYEEEL